MGDLGAFLFRDPWKPRRSGPRAAFFLPSIKRAVVGIWSMGDIPMVKAKGFDGPTTACALFRRTPPLESPISG